MDFLYQDIDALETPVGAFVVTDGEQRVRFCVTKNTMNTPYTCDAPAGGEIVTDTNYIIAVPTERLALGKAYQIRFTAGDWAYCDSDEQTVCDWAVIGGWAVGLGGYDPNDMEKLDQAILCTDAFGTQYFAAPAQYDESRFSEYAIESLPERGGFTFRLPDRSKPYIWFWAAWVQITQHAPEEYCAALGLWLC